MYTTYYNSGVDLFGVLDPQGFDATGEGFQTPELAQKVADQLNLQNLVP